MFDFNLEKNSTAVAVENILASFNLLEQECGAAEICNGALLWIVGTEYSVQTLEATHSSYCFDKAIYYRLVTSYKDCF